jgi:hypothetical protein
MNINFKENIDIRVTAAQIGISDSQWDYADESWSREYAIDFMKRHHYDILPINDNGHFEMYWSTKEKGKFDQIEKREIDNSNSIYYLTELQDLLQKFKDSQNRSYFLTNHSKTIGLVSNVNLNSKPVYVYFYSLMSKIEIDLGSWLKAIFTETELIELIRDKGKNAEDSLSIETLKRFEFDRQKNVANHFVEYLYLTQFQYIIKRMRFASILGYRSNSEFDKEFKIISKYRNWLAHPINTTKQELSEDLFQLHVALDRVSNSFESISIDLIKAYYTTAYKTTEEPLFLIKIGRQNKELDNYLEKKNVVNWVFITAENPNSIRLDDVENTKRNSELEEKLIEGKFTYFKGIGEPSTSDWQAEKSFLVLNMDVRKANELANIFDQNSFVYGKKGDAPELRRVN